MSASAMLAAARKTLGMAGRPNVVTRDYASRHGDVFLRAAWCNMAITRWARESGNATAVLPEGDRAYTVWCAEDGERLGLWYTGTATNIKRYAQPGAIVFFDWGGADAIAYIDHVGIVERNLGDGRVQTIEGNTGDACKRRVRSASVIAGFWNPPYAVAKPAKPKPTPNPTEVAVKKLPTLKRGAGLKDNDPLKWHVKTLHHLLIARDYAGLDGVDDTVFTEAHENGVKGLQDAAGLEVDGVVGPLTWPVLLRVA
ncbi:CHAP domain-containing protein [Streptosporangium canum]|uniref:CHAP domain-containing protein n=1 Tax=Streptosporangium canum TaxID=324952 RepID=UPI0036A639E8